MIYFVYGKGENQKSYYDKQDPEELVALPDHSILTVAPHLAAVGAGADQAVLLAYFAESARGAEEASRALVHTGADAWQGEALALGNTQVAQKEETR